MARKTTPIKPATNPTVAPVRKSVPAAAAAAVPVSSGVRNSPIPRAGAAPGVAGRTPTFPTHEQIARRAYEISRSATGGSEIDNWLRAERELRSQGR